MATWFTNLPRNARSRYLNEDPAASGAAGGPYPIATQVSFSDIVEAGGQSFFPGVTLTSGDGGVGGFRFSANYVKQQITATLFQVNLKIQVRSQAFPSVPAGCITTSGSFQIDFNADAAGLNFPPNTSFDATTEWYVGISPFQQTNALVQTNNSRIRFNWISPTAIRGQTGYIQNNVILPGGASTGKLESDPIEFVYFTSS